MQKCPNCGQQNRPGVIFCENCGASLIGKLPLSTRALDSIESELPDIGVDASTVTDVSIQGTATFEHGMLVRLEVEGSPDPIRFNPGSETIFGRRDPATGDKPDIDLTPFAGYRMGVSRRHAAIRPGDENGLDLWDLGSSNGTFLNGQRLSAHRPYRLRDGDEIRLGQMVIHLYFEREASLTPVPPPAASEAEAAPEAEAAKPEPAPAAPAPPAEDRPTVAFRPRPAAEAAEAKEPASQDEKPAEASAAPAEPAPSALEPGQPSGPPTPDRPVPASQEPDQPAGPPAPDRPVPSEPTQAPEPADEPAPQPEPEPKAEPPVPLDSKPEPKAEQPAAPAPPSAPSSEQPEPPASEPPVPTAPDVPSPAEPALPAEPPAPEPAPPEPEPEPKPEPDDKQGG